MKALLEILKALYSIKDAIINKKNNSSEGEGGGSGSSEDNPFQYLVDARDYVLPIDEWFEHSSDNNNLLILKKDLTVKDLFPTYTDKWIEIFKKSTFNDMGLSYTFNKYDILSGVASYSEDNKICLMYDVFPVFSPHNSNIVFTINQGDSSAFLQPNTVPENEEEVVSWIENLTEDTILFQTTQE